MNQKRNRIFTILPVLLVLVGLGLLLYAFASNAWYNWQVSQEISQYNQVAEGTGTDCSSLWEAAEEYNRQLAEGSLSLDTSADYVAQFLNHLGTGMMGYPSIPAIDAYLPIYQGTDETALQSGVGYWLGASLPTGGESTHCVLTSHTGLSKAKMFTDLDKLQTGDTFTLIILDRTLTYEVDQILVTEPDDLSALQIVDGEDYVTLYTCTPYGVNTHRLLVRGHRVETAEETADADSGAGQIILIAALALLALLLVVLLLAYHRRKKDRQTTSPFGDTAQTHPRRCRR
ncbi:MAG: class C sortase [Clostridiales bacterium]|nr:class C sortase [Clostridiales bacterium]